MKEIKAHACAEIVEKKSRFIADVFPVESAEAAAKAIAAVKKEHYDARHHCYAYIIEGSDGAPPLERASDDGEPQGTAGGPILNVLRGEGLTNALCIVTRYFGGTLLGTGGLARAYTAAAKEALDAADICEKLPAKRMTVSVSYNLIDNVLYLLKQYGISPESAEYEASAVYDIIVRSEQADALIQDLQQKTDGAATVRITDSLYHSF